MRRLVAFIVVLFGAAVPSMVVSFAGAPTVAAQTATARALVPITATGTPTPPLAWPTSTPTRTAAPTLAPDRRPMQVGGSVWVNASPSFGTITAFVGDTECASSEPKGFLHEYLPRLILYVPSALERPGCGTPGAIVRFVVDGYEASQTVAWFPDTAVRVRIVIGPDYASYAGGYVLEQPDELWTVVPLINGVECGYQVNPLLGQGPEWSYHVIVFDERYEAGCARPGSVVRFVVRELREGGKVLAVSDETVIWQAGASASLDLTMNSIRLPSAGASPEPAPNHHLNAIAFFLAGVALVTLGLHHQER